MSRALAIPRNSGLMPEDEAALNALFRRGTSANTLRAWEQDLAYIAAWKNLRFDAGLVWPEAENVVLRFVLDHVVDLRSEDGRAHEVCAALIGQGLRKSFACPAPSTLDRRLASWRAFHRFRNLSGPFANPLIAEARQKGRKVAARLPAPKSPRPITRPVLEQILAALPRDIAGLRDRALFMLAFASGGRRRAEVAGLDVEDIDQEDWAARSVLWIRLRETKTTGPDQAVKLPLKGRAAAALLEWMRAARLTEGPLFRPISKAKRVLPRRITAEALRLVLQKRLIEAGFAADFATMHGLRAGFLTQAALDGAPLQAAMKLSLHRSPIQAQKYYADVEIADNPAADLLG